MNDIENMFSGLSSEEKLKLIRSLEQSLDVDGWNQKDKKLTHELNEALPPNMETLSVFIGNGNVQIIETDQSPYIKMTTEIVGYDKSTADNQLKNINPRIQVQENNVSCYAEEADASGTISSNDYIYISGRSITIINGKTYINGVPQGAVDAEKSIKTEVTVGVPKDLGFNTEIEIVNGRLLAEKLSGNHQVRIENGKCSISSLVGSLRYSSANGIISCNKLTGELKTSMTNGKVEVGTLYGTVRANSTNGAITIERALLNPGESQIMSTNGRITVGFLNKELRFNLSSVNGRVQPPQNATIERERGNQVRGYYGTLSSTQNEVLIETTNGKIILSKVGEVELPQDHAPMNSISIKDVIPACSFCGSVYNASQIEVSAAGGMHIHNGTCSTCGGKEPMLRTIQRE